MILAESGDWKEESSQKARVWRFVALVLRVRVGETDVGLEIYTTVASLASNWLCIEPPSARLRRAVMGLALAIFCRTVMKSGYAVEWNVVKVL
jgi:hypothetical protein